MQVRYPLPIPGGRLPPEDVFLDGMNTIMEALADVDYAFRHLEFAIRLMCYCESGHIDLSQLDTDLSILLERENVSFPSGTFANIEAVIPASQAPVGMAFGTSAMVLVS